MPDAALMSEGQKALASSLEEVIREREIQVLRIAYRILGNWADAEDVAQEAFLRLHRRGLPFDSDAALGSWLYRVTVNLCLDRARALKPLEELPDVMSDDASAESVMILEQQKRKLMTALGTLPPRERAAVVLREIEGLSTAEVASILGSREVTVRSQVAKAVSRLRALLSREKV
jgi:RNA polymerase sigma-70 factor, ECF subfamily